MAAFPDNEPDVYNHYLPLGWTVDNLTPPQVDVSQWSNAVTAYSYTSTAGTNPQQVKMGSSGLLAALLFNTNANFDRYIRFYDIGMVPTAGTGTPKKTVVIPRGGMALIASQGGETFTSGIGFTITGGSGDSDVTPIFANDVLVYIGHS
jgi:hypothetical protein